MEMERRVDGTRVADMEHKCMLLSLGYDHQPESFDLQVNKRTRGKKGIETTSGAISDPYGWIEPLS